ncbi:MAG: YHS domain-containing protein [Symploca sp. SIO2E6]|nr:YHS domain-containing protein [Symploca sp. SIO2E6]
MKTKYLTTLAAASILSLGLVVGCANPERETTNSQADTTNPQADTTNPQADTTNSQADTTNSQTDTTNSQADTTNPEVEATPTIATKASTDESIKIRFYTENGVAIDGTDPVAYFQESKPVPGNSAYTYEWMDATWQFASAENRDLFAQNPEKYAPQYGGFCAWAVSRDYTAPTEPDAWKIVDGKLYLNFNRRVQRDWEKDISGNIASANRNWPGVLNK